MFFGDHSTTEVGSFVGVGIAGMPAGWSQVTVTSPALAEPVRLTPVEKGAPDSALLQQSGQGYRIRSDSVAARFVLGRVSARTPGWAVQWLADGHDGEALREVAGLNGRDTRALDDLMPAVPAEMGVDSLPGTLEAVTTVFRNISTDCLAGRLDERAVAQQVEEIVISHDYASEITDLPLDQPYGLDDEWQGGWGATVEQLRATGSDTRGPGTDRGAVRCGVSGGPGPRSPPGVAA